MENKTVKSKYSKIQRIGALIGVIALAGLSVATLVVALLGNEVSDGLFFRLLVTTISAPIAIWLLVWAFGAIHRPKNSEDPEAEEGESSNG